MWCESRLSMRCRGECRKNVQIGHDPILDVVRVGPVNFERTIKNLHTSIHLQKRRHITVKVGSVLAHQTKSRPNREKVDTTGKKSLAKTSLTKTPNAYPTLSKKQVLRTTLRNITIHSFPKMFPTRRTQQYTSSLSILSRAHSDHSYTKNVCSIAMSFF